MTESQKATRATIKIGSLEVEGFMLPDGSYRMSQAQVAECIGDDAIYARRFLKSRALKALQGGGYTPDTFEVEPTDQVRGQTRIQGWPLDIVYTYWVYRCSRGNKQSFSLVIALGSESLERRFDNAFGVQRSEEEYNTLLANRVQQLEQQAGEAFAAADDERRNADRLEQQLREAGIVPYWEKKADDD